MQPRPNNDEKKSQSEVMSQISKYVDPKRIESIQKQSYHFFTNRVGITEDHVKYAKRGAVGFAVIYAGLSVVTAGAVAGVFALVAVKMAKERCKRPVRPRQITASGDSTTVTPPNVEPALPAVTPTATPTPTTVTPSSSPEVATPEASPASPRPK